MSTSFATHVYSAAKNMVRWRVGVSIGYIVLVPHPRSTALGPRLCALGPHSASLSVHSVACPSRRPSARPSVHPSATPSARDPVHPNGYANFKQPQDVKVTREVLLSAFYLQGS